MNLCYEKILGGENWILLAKNIDMSRAVVKKKVTLRPKRSWKFIVN
jgi:hypothetical protein